MKAGLLGACLVVSIHSHSWTIAKLGGIKGSISKSPLAMSQFTTISDIAFISFVCGDRSKA
jgi:hypothetical protein